MITDLLHVYSCWLGVAVASAAPSIFFYVKGRLNA